MIFSFFSCWRVFALCLLLWPPPFCFVLLLFRLLLGFLVVGRFSFSWKSYLLFGVFERNCVFTGVLFTFLSLILKIYFRFLFLLKIAQFFAYTFVFFFAFLSFFTFCLHFFVFFWFFFGCYAYKFYAFVEKILHFRENLWFAKNFVLGSDEFCGFLGGLCVFIWKILFLRFSRVSLLLHTPRFFLLVSLFFVFISLMVLWMRLFKKFLIVFVFSIHKLLGIPVGSGEFFYIKLVVCESCSIC